MKFDLFDAMVQMRRAFGEGGEILLRQVPGLGLAIRLQIFSKGEIFCEEFIVDNSEIFTDNSVFITNIKFRRAVKQLEHYIEKL